MSNSQSSSTSSWEIAGRRFIPVDQILRVAHNRQARPTDRRAAQDSADGAIAHLEAQLLAHRRAKNAFQPLCSLPEDVLLQIFQHAMLILGAPGDCACDEKDLGWTILTHLCWRWRTYALETPVLWTSIALDAGPAWSQAFLERSRLSPIYAEQKLSHIATSSYSTLISEILSHHSVKLKALKLIVDRAVAGQMKQLFSRTRLPLLEELHLIAVGGASFDLNTRYTDDLPRLRILSLTEFSSIPPAITPRSLTHLYIDMTQEARRSTSLTDSQPRLGWAEFRSLFHRCASLQDLTLIDAIPLSSSPVQLAHEPIPMPPAALELLSLRVITLQDDPNRCGFFLNLLRAPRLSNFNLETSARVMYNLQDQVNLLTYIFSHAVQPQALHVYELGEDRDAICLHGIGRHPSRWFRLVFRHDRDQARDPLRWANIHATDFITNMCFCVSHEHLLHLSLDTYSVLIPTSKWLSTFRGAVNVQSLHFWAPGSDSELINSLALSTKSTSEFSTVLRKEDMLFPSLTQLHIHGVNFEGRYDAGRSLAQVLEQAMATRATLGSFLRDLQLRSCSHPEGFVERLKAAVPANERDWDLESWSPPEQRRSIMGRHYVLSGSLLYRE